MSTSHHTTMVIPYTQYQQFLLAWQENLAWQQHLRLGQAFYNWANLHKMTQTPWLDRLYNADNKTAREMMEANMDWFN